MFLDASVIVALLAREADYLEIAKLLERHTGSFFVSPLAKFEASVALARISSSTDQKRYAELLHASLAAVDRFLTDINAQEVAITPEIGRIALNASATYGKAVGHVANLNFGDCFAYACAKSLAVPLAYKGNDFAHTDLA